MITIGRLTSLTILTAMATSLGGCLYLEDNLTQYAQRSDKLTLSAGNAQATNEAVQMIDPWPPASANRRIPTNGERVAGAIERYRNVDKAPPKPTISPPGVLITGSTAIGSK